MIITDLNHEDSLHDHFNQFSYPIRFILLLILLIELRDPTNFSVLKDIVT